MKIADEIFPVTRTFIIIYFGSYSYFIVNTNDVCEVSSTRFRVNMNTFSSKIPLCMLRRSLISLQFIDLHLAYLREMCSYRR